MYLSKEECAMILEALLKTTNVKPPNTPQDPLERAMTLISALNKLSKGTIEDD